MNELQPIPNAIAWENKPLENGRITTIRPVGDYTGFSFKQSISQGDSIWLVCYAYHRKGTYDVLYAVMNAAGDITATLQEKEGILPTLFHAPGGAVWAVLTPYHPDKELETFLPISGRAGITPLKPGRQFPGDFIGTIDNTVLCWNEDIFSDKKPDKLQLLEFEAGQVKKKSELKIDMPKGNKPLIAQGKIWLFSWGEEELFCRSMDLNGRILSAKKLAFYPVQFQALSVKEDGAITFFYTEEDGLTGICEIDAAGKANHSPLLATGLDFYETWPPVWLSNDTFLIRFTHEDGNGWIIVRGTTVLECFVQGKKGGLFTDLVSKKSIRLYDKDLVLWDAVKQAENGYAVSFYPSTGEDKQAKGAKEILVWQGSIA
jgi:hypothetical protein